MALAIGTPLPSLDGATGWINGDSESAAKSGAPLLVLFWSMSCPGCKKAVPRVLSFLATYSDHGLRLLSIHMPRGPWDLDTDNIRKVLDELHLTGPCAIDNNHALGKAFETKRVWPSYFFFDADGRLRSRASGQLGLKMAENSVRRMLGVEDSVTPEQHRAGDLTS